MNFSSEGESFKASALRVEAAKGASYAYSVESMLYMTVGLMDLYHNTNIDVETAIVKVAFRKKKILFNSIYVSREIIERN